MKEYIIADRIIRSRISSSVPIELTSVSNENQLGDFLLQHQNEIPLFQGYPYVIAREYHVFPPYSQYGSGDFVFANGKGNFLVVEIKFLHTGVGRNARGGDRDER